ncbi:hypothetical protein HYQ45_000664 [Verticillium longisporum]|nr:hypothetical protein HYQ45_000664 [Verticillium longisporum]
MHLVGCLSITFHLSVQAAGSLFATFCGVIVLAASVGLAGDKEPSSAFNGFVAVLCGFGVLWTLFIVGFLQASWAWHRRDCLQQDIRASSGSAKGYGTTSGELAVEQEGLDDLQ